MNSAMLFRFAEGGALALATLAARALAVWPRRRWGRRVETDRSPVAKWLHAELASLVFPALALGPVVEHFMLWAGH